MTKSGARFDTDDSVREEAYKLVIKVSLSFAFVCVFGLCLSLPWLYSYTQNMRNYAGADLTYCDETTRDMADEIEYMRTLVRYDLRPINRSKRFEESDAGSYAAPPPQQYAPIVIGPAFQECPACCQPGARGPVGDPGMPGLNGAPGPNGAIGRPGNTPNASCIPERVFEPPPCLPCPQGPRGATGHPGFPGGVGDPGIPGRPGYDGVQGPAGTPGGRGPVGPDGLKGPPGDVGLTPEVKLIPGPSGQPGDPGAWGLPGHSGPAGEDGLPGTPGDKGWPGDTGDPGDPGPYGTAGPGGHPGNPGNPGECSCQDTQVLVPDTYGLTPAPYAGYPGPPLTPSPSYGKPSYGGGGGGYNGGGGGGGGYNGGGANYGGDLSFPGQLPIDALGGVPFADDGILLQAQNGGFDQGFPVGFGGGFKHRLRDLPNSVGGKAQSETAGVQSGTGQSTTPAASTAKTAGVTGSPETPDDTPLWWASLQRRDQQQKQQK